MRTKDKANVYKVAALIKSQGLKQNLVVSSHDTKHGKPPDKFGVVARRRRLRALKPR